MNILVVAGWIWPDAEGGSFRVAFETARALARRGHRVSVMTGRVRPEDPFEETIYGVRVCRYETATSSGMGFYLSTLRAVSRMYRERFAHESIDVIHTHHPVSALAVHLCRAARPIPKVHTLHIAYFLEYLDRGGHRLGGRMLHRMERFYLRRCGRIVVLSEFVRRQLEEHFPGCPASVTEIPAGIDLDRFRPVADREEVRRRLGLPSQGRLALTVRRLEPRMGLDVLLQAVPMTEGVHFLVAGRGSMDEELRALVGRLGIRDRVTFLGFVKDEHLPAYLAAADGFVLPTRALEGFGVVTLEALACGTPVLGTPVGATPEILGPLDPSLVMGGISSEAMAESINAFFARKDHEALRERCRLFAERFSWDEAAVKYEEVFQDAIR
jgi:glycosyltransferase involved in cell wall biosynthesis